MANVEVLKSQRIKTETFKDELRKKMDEYVHFVYDITKQFPREELYSSVSQWRRSTLSIILNYIEGYARQRPLVQLNFLEISYGSFKESKYLLYFSQRITYITERGYNRGLEIVEEIGAMLWTELSALEKSVKSAKRKSK